MIQAIKEHLDNLEGLYLAEQSLIENRAGRSKTYTLEARHRAPHDRFWDSCHKNRFATRRINSAPVRPASASTTHKSRYVKATSLT